MATTPDRPDRGHTPTPWRVEAGTHLIWGNCTTYDDGTPDYLGIPCATAYRSITTASLHMPVEEMDANAAFIVRAVNCHDDLVAALRDARDFVDNELCSREQICTDDGEDDIIRGGKPYVGEARDLLAKIDSTLSLVGVVE